MRVSAIIYNHDVFCLLLERKVWKLLKIGILVNGQWKVVNEQMYKYLLILIQIMVSEE